MNNESYTDVKMKVCMMVECGGLEQPHTYDHGIGAMDCDGPCSDRRVRHWRASLPKTELPTLKPSVSGRYQMHGREVLLLPLALQNRSSTIVECFDCAAPALCVVIERPDGEDIAKDAWTWCGVCSIGG